VTDVMRGIIAIMERANVQKRTTEIALRFIPPEHAMIINTTEANATMVATIAPYVEILRGPILQIT